MIEKIEARIIDLDRKNVDISMLEEAKVINNLIGVLSIRGHKQEDVDYLSSMLKDVMRKKFTIVFPNFDSNIIDKMMTLYYFGMFYIPYEIEIFGDAVFVRCHVINDFGDISGDRIYSLKNGLVDINHYEYFNINIDKSDFESEEYEQYFDAKEVKMKVVDFICNSINSIYGKDVVTPLYKTYSPLYDGINTNYGYKVSISFKFHEICKAMYEGKNVIINLSIIEREKDIHYYEIEQIMSGGIPNWIVLNKYTNSCKMSKVLKR